AFGRLWVQWVKNLELVLAVREHFEREHGPLVAAFRARGSLGDQRLRATIVLDVVLELVTPRAQPDKSEFLQRLLQVVLTDEAEGTVRLATVVDGDGVGADAHETGKVAADRRRSWSVAERASCERAIVGTIVRAGAVRQMRLDVVFVDRHAFTGVRLHDRRVVDHADVQRGGLGGESNTKTIPSPDRDRKVDEDRLFERAEQIVMRVVGWRAANRWVMIDLVGQREGEVAVTVNVHDEDSALGTVTRVRHAPDLVAAMLLPEDIFTDRGDLHAVLGEDRCAVRAIVDEEREGTTAGNQAGDVAAELLLRDRKIAVDVLVIARRRAEIVALDVVGVLVAVAGSGIDDFGT